MKKTALILLATILFFGCKKDDEIQPPLAEEDEPNLIFHFVFNEDQERLNNLGQPSVLPSNHGAQSPNFNEISAHYIELVPNLYSPLGEGKIVYQGAETLDGGNTAIDFREANIVNENETFYSIPLSSVGTGGWMLLRVSLSYQNYDIDFLLNGETYSGSLASFIGYNNYIDSYHVGSSIVDVFDDKLQGYWGFESNGFVTEGQAPEGATTVPNPIQSTSPIPPGSCLVTGEFLQPLMIDGNETEDIHIAINLSTNQSFEWVEVTEDGLWEPQNNENVVDMGIRGMIPEVLE